MNTKYRVIDGIQVIALCDSLDEAQDWLDRFPASSLERVTDNFGSCDKSPHSTARNGY